MDIHVSNEGTLFLFQPHTARAQDWIAEHVDVAAAQWVGSALVVEHRYARDLADSMQADGLELE